MPGIILHQIERTMDTMSRKLLLAGVMARVMALGTIPALAATQSADASYVRMAGQDVSTAHKGQPPQMKNGEQPPEPPKDENGNPLPPDGQGMQGHNEAGRNSSQMPESPKDENGTPLPPPDGFQHGQQTSK